MKDQNTTKKQLSEELIQAVGQYIEEYYKPEPNPDEILMRRSEYADSDLAELSKASDEDSDSWDLQRIEPDVERGAVLQSSRSVYGKKEKSLHDILVDADGSFQKKLFSLIDARGMSDSEVYKKAHIDRKLFSKIRSSSDYIPRKRNVLALALALELNLDETWDLLNWAGMSLSPGSKSDLIVEFCIRNSIYDIDEVNDLLYEYDQPVLG